MSQIESPRLDSSVSIEGVVGRSENPGGKYYCGVPPLGKVGLTDLPKCATPPTAPTALPYFFG